MKKIVESCFTGTLGLTKTGCAENYPGWVLTNNIIRHIVLYRTHQSKQVYTVIRMNGYRS